MGRGIRQAAPHHRRRCGCSKTPSGRLPHVLKSFPARSYLPEVASPQRDPDLLVLLAAALVALLRVSSTDETCVRTAMG